MNCVLHIDSGPTFRGGQRQLLLLAQAQLADTEGPVPQILACDPRLLAAAERAGVSVLAWHGPVDPRGVLQLRKLLHRAPGALLHVHDSRSMGAVRLLASDAAQRRLVVHRRIDDRPRQRLLTRWKYRRGSFICVSRAVSEVLHDFGIPKSRLHVVHSALPNGGQMLPPAREGGGEGPLRLLAMGALVHHKGHQVLLDALAASGSDVVLRIVGQGRLRAQLAERSRALGIEGRVAFLGDAVDLAVELRGCDLLVHPSLSEGLGTAVLDAMWAARPVLASAVGGLPELVDDPVTGWLVPPGDALQLASRIDEIAATRRDQDGELRARGVAGWQRAQRHFGIRDAARSINHCGVILSIPMIRFICHGKAIMPLLRSSPRTIFFAALSACMKNGIGKSLASVMRLFTKPGQMTFTFTPSGANAPRNPSP